MKKEHGQVILVLLINFLFGINIIIAQEKNYFIGDPDKNIERILIYNADNKNDTLSLNSIVEFNKNAKVIKESQPEYHIHVNYKYDIKGRLVEKEALYGESFANGVTSYEYFDKFEIEKNLAMGYYSETRKEIDEVGKTIKTTTWYVAGGMGESKIETILFTYGKEGLLSGKSINITYFDLEIEPGVVQELQPKELISKLKVAGVSRKEQFIEKNKYNSAKKLIYKELLNSENEELLNSTTYEYNNSGLLIKELKVCANLSDISIDYPCEKTEIVKKYNAQNQLESITTKRGNYLNIDSYKEGRLVRTIEKYASNLSYQYTYKYEYYSN